MKYSIAPFLILAGALLTGPGTALATSIKGYHCQCYVAENQSCSCSYNYNLSPLATTEFRAYCDALPNDVVFPDIAVYDKASSTSCTIQWGILANPQYRSKSCSSWSLTHTDNMNIKVTCHNWEDQGGPG